MFESQHKTPTIEIKDEILDKMSVRLFIKRDDLIHPKVSGNKWRKLKYNLIEAKNSGYKGILTFGGAFSNHIYATAAAGKAMGLKMIGIIRGEEISDNPTLNFAKSCGMDLQFVSRTEYRQRHEPEYLDEIKKENEDYYIIPEGGTNHLALKGVGEIVGELEQNYHIIACAVGTGGTLAGIINEMPTEAEALGFVVLKNVDYIKNDINNLIRQRSSDLEAKRWKLETEYHFSGYAKFKPELIDFINSFNLKHKILLDPVYTGKALFGIFDKVKNGEFKKGSSILFIHTGGLQGIVGFNQRYGNLIYQ